MTRYEIKGKTDRANEVVLKYAKKRFSIAERVMMRRTGVKWDKQIISYEPAHLRLTSNLTPAVFTPEIIEEYRKAVYENLLLSYKVPFEEFEIGVKK